MAMRRWVYAALAVARVFCACFALGMIHPDEFFQSQEVMARHVLHGDQQLQRQLHVPWEFRLPTPNRSVLFPALVAGLPYRLMEWLGVTPTGSRLLLIPRLLLCVSSFFLDAALWKCAKALHHPDPMGVVLSFASSWTTLIFLSRPFSNTFETLVLAACMLTLLCMNPHRNLCFQILHPQTLWLGALLAVGFFTRFTFPLFFFPLGLELVRRQDEILQTAFMKKNSQPGVLRRLMRAISIAVQGFISFASCSLCIIVLDSIYFRGMNLPVETVLSPAWLNENLVIAPLNNLKYNMHEFGYKVLE
ncbi:hypothetical protein P43SY_006144 [Pythium insidiosum]|uniref:Mannosyltransferase n=1 Tax=Pythium insidiosum TaxID=114742 RepID=A0AAD5Q6U0_PYTIN|nr:hypothetical protein P43SY_006144 [Pythium insidiosum]